MNTGGAKEFWRHVYKTSGCWEWLGAKTTKGAGQLNRKPRRLLAHRYSWELANGEIPAGLHVLRSCRNKLCVRPDHLFLGKKVGHRKCEHAS